MSRLAAVASSSSQRVSTGRNAIVTWAKNATQGYEGVNIRNLNKSWANGLAFCALVDHYIPDSGIDFASLDPTKGKENCEKAFAIAKEKLNVPLLLDPEDVSVEPDDISVNAYLTEFYKVVEGGITSGGLMTDSQASVMNQVNASRLSQTPVKKPAVAAAAPFSSTLRGSAGQSSAPATPIPALNNAGNQQASATPSKGHGEVDNSRVGKAANVAALFEKKGEFVDPLSLGPKPPRRPSFDSDSLPRPAQSAPAIIPMAAPKDEPNIAPAQSPSKMSYSQQMRAEKERQEALAREQRIQAEKERLAQRNANIASQQQQKHQQERLPAGTFAILAVGTETPRDPTKTVYRTSLSAVKVPAPAPTSAAATPKIQYMPQFQPKNSHVKHMSMISSLKDKRKSFRELNPKLTRPDPNANSKQVDEELEDIDVVKSVLAIQSAFNTGKFDLESMLFGDLAEKYAAFDKMANFGALASDPDSRTKLLGILENISRNIERLRIKFSSREKSNEVAKLVLALKMLIHDVVNILVEGPDPEGMPASEPIPAATVFKGDDYDETPTESEPKEGDSDKDNTMREEIEKLRRLLTAKDEMLKKLKENAATSKANQSNEIERVKELENENTQKEETVRQLQRQLAQQTQDYDKLKVKVDKADKEVEKLEKEKRDAEQDMNDLRSTIRRKDQRIEASKKEQEEYKEKLTKERNDEIDNFEKIVASYQKEIDEYKSLIDAQEKTITELSEGLETQTKVILEYETSKNSSGKDDSELQKELVGKAAEIADLKSALTKKTAEFDQLAISSREGATKEQVEDYDKRIRELNERVTRFHTSLDEEKAKTASFEEKFQQASAELEETKLILAKKQRDYEETKSQQSELREDEFKFLNNQVEKQKADLEKMTSQLESKQKFADHYKEKFEQTKKQNVEISTALSGVKTELEQVKGTKSGDFDELEEEVKALKQLNSKLKADLEKAKAASAAPAEGVTLAPEEVERLRSLLKTARAQIHGLKFQLAHGDKSFDEGHALSFEERESTQTFIALVLKRLGVAEGKFPTYIARWKDAMGGEFCKVSARVRSLVESSQWPKVVLEMVPAQNSVIKAEIESVMKHRKEDGARRAAAAKAQESHSVEALAPRGHHERAASATTGPLSPRSAALNTPGKASAPGPIIAATPTQKALLTPPPQRLSQDGRGRRQTISVSNSGASGWNLLPPAIAKQQQSPKK